MLGLVGLVGVLVLGAGPAAAQTVTISPTAAQTVEEGNSFSFSVTVTDAGATHAGYIDFFPDSASIDDFEVYKQATAPTGSDTPVTLDSYQGTYYYEIFSGSPPASAVTFWLLAKTDSAYLEPDETLTFSASIQLNADPWDLVSESSTLHVTLTDGPLPDPTDKPTMPTNLTATAGKGAITLTWDAFDTTSSNTNLLNDANITKHQFRQSTDGGANYGTWTDIPSSAFTEVNATTYTVGSLTDGTQYTFQVRAVNGCTATTGCGESDPAAATMATPDAGGLERPTGLTATAGNTQITLTWTDPGDPAILYYEYQQKEGTAGFGAWTGIPDSSATTTSHRLTGLTNGTAYSYRIRVRTSVKPSAASDAVTATPQGVLPGAPSLTATPRSGAVTLTWPDPVDASLQGYDYQYRVGTEVYQPWQAARERSEEDCVLDPASVLCRPPYVRTSGATLQFPIGGLTNGTPHTFRIRAVNADGTTTSNEATATPVGGVPAKPTGLTTRLRTSTVRVLEWDGVADASILRYEYTTDEGRTWSLLTSDGSADQAGLPEDQFLSGYTFRIRAVNAAGPSPASDPAVEEEETVRTVVVLRSASLEWDATSKKATLVWDPTEHANLRWWSIVFHQLTHSNSDDLNANLPIGTTRYEIPGTFEAGDDVAVWIIGCVTSGCRTSVPGDPLRFEAGAPNAVLTGLSATPGDGEVTLAWDDPMDSSVTHFEYERVNVATSGRGQQNVPDGGDAGTSPADETSYTVPNLTNGDFHRFRLRAVNTNGAGPWTASTPEVMPLAAGVPAAPQGLVTLTSGAGGGHDHGHGDTPPAVTTWDDPQDPSITGYQRWDSSARKWPDIPGSDATTTGVDGRVIRLRAVNANGVGPWAETTTVHSPTPARPTGLQAAPGPRRVTLTWDDPGKGVFIEFYRYTTDGGETWTDIPDSETTAQGHVTRYTVPNLTNGQAYTFAILAENDTGASPPSAAVTATPRGGAPAKPTGLSATPGDAEATLTWDHPVDASITKYQVKQGDANWVDISGSDAGTTSHTVGSLTNGTAYTFQVRAVNDHNGDSTDDPGPASDPVTVRPGRPTAPATLSVAPGDAQATLSWTAPASDGGSAVTGYEYTSNAGAATPTWTDVPDSGSDGRADETEFTVTGLVNNTAYAFAVRAENANGPGVATPALRATPVPPGTPQRPVGMTATPGHEQVRLTWTLPNFQHPVTSYQYRQSTDGGAMWNPDWTTIPGSGAATAAHRVTGLTNGTTYTFELRARNGAATGPAARAQAIPSEAAADEVIDFRSSGRLTNPLGSTYTVTQLSPPAGLNWRIAVPGTTDIDGRTFILRSLQGTTPETASRYAFTSTGQEGLDIAVEPRLAGSAQVCLEPSPLLRREAGSRPLLVLRYSGAGWTPLPTTTEGGMLCGATSDFSAFILGYQAAGGGGGPGGGGGDTPSGPNAAPEAARSLPRRTVPAGETSAPLDLAPYFTDPDGDPLRFAAVSSNTGVVIADLPRGSSRLTLLGVAAGEATVVVTARDPAGAEASQSMTVTVRPTNAAPEVAQSDYAFELEENRNGQQQPVDLGVVVASDPDGDALTYSLAWGGGARFAVGARAGVVRYVGPGEDFESGPNRYELGVRVRDPDGEAAEARVTVTVVNVNEPPEAIGVIPDQALEEGGEETTVELTPFFGDEDGDALTYGAESSDASVVTVVVSGAVLTLTPVAHGSAMVTVTAEDVEGLTATQVFAVGVSDRLVRWAVSATLAGMARSHLASVRATVGRRVISGVGEGSRLTVLGRPVPLTREAARAQAESMAANWLTGALPAGAGQYGADRGAGSGLPLFGGITAGATGSGTGMTGSGASSGAGSFPGLGSALSFNGGADPWRGSEFLLTLGGGQEGDEARGRRWHAWGSGDVQAFQGTPSEFFENSGALLTGYLGMDTRLNERWVTGLALSRGRGNGDWRAGGSRGSLTATVTALHPYAQWSDGTNSVWATAGGGVGSAVNERQSGRTKESGLALGMGLVEVRRRLGWRVEGLKFDLRADAAWAQLRTGSGEETIDGHRVGVSQARVGTEFSRLEPIQVGRMTVAPFGELHLRGDRGTGATGAGLEVSVGARAAAGRVQMEAQGRLLAVHSVVGYRERGLAVRLGLMPREPEGLSLSVAPRWGDAAGGGGALWQDHVYRHQVPAGERDAWAVQARGGYGLRLRSGPLITWIASFDHSRYDRRFVIGARLGGGG